MSNRLLSLLVLVIVFGGLYGLYYYFFVASTASLSVSLSGSGTTSVTLVSEFKNSYSQECNTSCVFGEIPAVNYTLSAKHTGYAPVEKTFKLGRGERKHMEIAMEKEAVLTEQTKKKEETIAVIKLKNSIQEALESNTGAVVMGYRDGGLYYALPSSSSGTTAVAGEMPTEQEWTVFRKKEGSDAQEMFRLPTGILSNESLDVYDGYISLEKNGNTFFYSLQNGTEADMNLPGNVLGVKDTPDNDTKIVTTGSGVFLYSVSEKSTQANPLYDDIIELPTGEIVALVKKTSTDKQSLLSLKDTSNDLVLLVGQDTRERKVLLKTPKNGKALHYRNGEILFVDEKEEVSVIRNVK